MHAHAGNQRVDLTWDSTPGAASYVVNVYGGNQGQSVAVNGTHATLFLTNGRTYAFVVTPFDANGQPGAPSDPVAATPALPNDLAYLAAGLIALWLGIFAYIGFLVRKEARLERKLQQLLAARAEGRSP